MKKRWFILVVFFLAHNFAFAQIVDRSIYENSWVFAFVNGSKPGMPVWDSNLKAFVPQANDNREIIVLDQTFSVPAGQTYLIENKIVYIRPTARADINIYGTLTIRNSFLSWQPTEHQQTGFRVQRNGTLDVKDSYSFRSNEYWVNWKYEDGSTVIFDNFVAEAWTSMDGSVNYTSRNFSTVKLTFLSNVYNSNINITDAHHLWLELYPPENSTFDISFPEKRHWIDWDLSNIWPNTTISCTTSYIYERDLGISNGTKATVRNSPDGFGLGWAVYSYGGPYDFITCELNNLGDPLNDSGKFYADTIWEIPSNNSSLHVINSKITKAWPVTWGQVHLIVRNSNLADPRIYSGNATIEIYNSCIDFFAAYAGTRGYLENCRVSSNQSWLTVSHESGSNNSAITLTAAANPTTAKRSAIITFTVTGVTTHRLTVTQEGGTSGLSDLSQNPVSVYPNPATHELTINYLKENSVLEIYDLSGRLLISKRAGSSLEKLDISNLAKGVYTLRITDSGNKKSYKFLK